MPDAGERASLLTAARHRKMARSAHAYARQMAQKERRAWRAELAKHHKKTLNAPSWLWTSVVDLVASHEAAYLEHCRRYAG